MILAVYNLLLCEFLQLKHNKETTGKVFLIYILGPSTLNQPGHETHPQMIKTIPN